MVEPPTAAQIAQLNREARERGDEHASMLCNELEAMRAQLAEAQRGATSWEDSARTFAQNADHHRERADAAEQKLAEVTRELDTERQAFKDWRASDLGLAKQVSTARARIAELEAALRTAKERFRGGRDEHDAQADSGGRVESHRVLPMTRDEAMALVQRCEKSFPSPENWAALLALARKGAEVTGGYEIDGVFQVASMTKSREVGRITIHPSTIRNMFSEHVRVLILPPAEVS